MIPIKLELEFGFISQLTSISAKADVPVNRIMALSGDELPRAFGLETQVAF